METFKFTDQQMIKKIKTVKDAFRELRLPYNELEINDTVDDIRKSTNAFYQLCIVTRVLNQNWTPDILNRRQYKWFNWFYYASDGAFVGLASLYADHSPANTTANIGGRLCFKSEELADYARKQFFSLYEDYLVIKQ